MFCKYRAYTHGEFLRATSYGDELEVVTDFYRPQVPQQLHL